MPRRRKLRIPGLEDDLGIPLSPLIDCVFLLLIFFLVTSMLKRRETILAVALPDATSSLRATAHEDILVIGLDEAGAFLEPEGRDPYGALAYRKGSSLEGYLDRLAAAERPAALRIEAARNTPFQKTIDALDICALRGFTNVSVRIRAPEEPRP